MNLKEDYWDGFLANACVYGGLCFFVDCVLVLGLGVLGLRG